MLDDILKYQECEQKLVELDNKINHSSAKKQVSAMSAIIKDEQSKLRSLSDQAKRTLNDYNDNKKKSDELTEQINKIISMPIDNLDEKQYKELIDKITKLTTTLENFQRNLSINGKDSDNISQAFANSKKRINDARTAGQKAKEILNKICDEVEPQKKQVQDNLKALEKSVNKDVLARYKMARNDNIFPVFVPLSNNTCGGCRMQTSAAFINKIKGKGYLECEQCRRLVYIK